MTTQWTEEYVAERIEARRRKRPRFIDEQITLAHGAGGKASRALVEGLILPAFIGEGDDDTALSDLGDAAHLGVIDGPVAFTTDTFVVTPITFPGGSIGELAINGTVNDLAVSGARPLAISMGLVLEEGLGRATLEAEVAAMAAATKGADVRLVCGDTKVVDRGQADQMYINTSGLGVVDPRASLGADRICAGDRVLVSGTIGDHGMAIMLARNELDITAHIESDTAPLWPAVEALLAACGAGVHAMRDATRGGVATVLNELALGAELGVVLDEAAVPVRDPVNGACELLGIDPLFVANEGKLVAFVAADAADDALAALRATGVGADAAIVGDVTEDHPGRVMGRTSFGGHRMIDLLVGDPLPRIC